MINGLFVWANSYCRSTLAFYRELGKAFNCPLKVVVLKGLSDARKKTGFSNSEFADLDVDIFDNLNSASILLDKFSSYYHIFGAYQDATSLKLIDLASKKNVKFGIASEAPCNMDHFPRRILKDIYLKFFLPLKVKDAITHSDFIINYSGDNSNSLISLGWPKSKIVPCGYYSPAIDGSTKVHRNKVHWENFSIFLSGIHQWHRSPLVLLKALKLLDERGIKYDCYISQKGPLFDEMEEFINVNKMTKVHLLGFLPIERLVDLYQSCSVYVGAGNYEPWGMRLNDALLCAAPLIVNRGMGGCKLVDDYECGLTFDRNNSSQLADCLQYLISDYNAYQQIADNAFTASQRIEPEAVASRIAKILYKQYLS